MTENKPDDVEEIMELLYPVPAAELEARRQAELTPYDKGERCEPHVWHIQPANKDAVETDRYGKVDYENEEEETIATLWIERGEDGSYILKGKAYDALTVQIEGIQQ